MEFEIINYVLDLTYSQTVCWWVVQNFRFVNVTNFLRHGFLFCPFLPLIAALKNVVIFFIKLISVVFFRRQSQLELSPARARYVFTTVLLFSFVWALLPIIFFVTVFVLFSFEKNFRLTIESIRLKPSRGCGPFRLYSSETDHYVYAPIRNLFNQIPYETLKNLIFTLTSGIVVIPVVLILV